MPKIIVGVNELDRSRDAAALAAQLASGSHAEVVLAAVYPYDDLPSRMANTEYRRCLRDEAEATIAKVKGSVPGLAEAPVVTVADVSPARALHRLTESEAPSMVVIGSSHRGGVGRVLAGTTAERLLHGSPCSVAVAPKGFAERPAAGIGTIVVAYDESDEAKAALIAATAIARSTGARLRIVQVLDMMWVGTPALMSGPGYIIPSAEVEEHARSRLAKVIAALPEDVEAESVVKVGDPPAMLAAQSKRADLVVTGSRAYGPHRAVVVGSVSGRLVREAACPVIVVPRGVESPLDELFPATSEAAAV